MKRKVVGILVCMMLLAMIPIAAGIDVCPEKDTTGTNKSPPGKKSSNIGIPESIDSP